MRWPDYDTLPVEVWAAFGGDPGGDPGDWQWTDLTGRLLPEPIHLRSGASDGAGEVSASTGTITLDNADGALTPLHPGSVYWPHVDLNVPIWIALRRAEDTFARTVAGEWGTSDSGDEWTVTGSASEYAVSGGAGLHQHSVVHEFRRTRLAGLNLLDVEQVVDISTPVTVTGASLVTGVIARWTTGLDYYWCRTEFNTDSTVTIKVTRANAGSSTEVGVLGAVPGLTYSPDVPVRMRARVSGSRISVRVWDPSGVEPAGWHLDVEDWEPLTQPGAVGCQSWLVLGNTNDLPVTPSFSNYTVRVDLLCGYADSWQPSYLPVGGGETRSVVRLTASGILRRLSQGAGTIRSPLRAAIPAEMSPVAYWPIEDGPNSTQIASALPGGAPATAIRGVLFAEDDTLPGSAPVAKIPSDGRIIAPVSMGDTNGWTVSFFFKLPAIPTVYAPLISIICSTTRWEIYTDADEYHWQIFDADDNEVDHVVFGFGDGTEPDRWVGMHVRAEQSGGNVDWVAAWTDTTPTGPAYHTGPQSFSGSVGRVVQLISDGYVDAAQKSTAHWFVVDSAVDRSGNVVAASYGWETERAADRIWRLCVENGIRAQVPVGESERLGVQPSGGLLEVLRDSERADMGILYEHEWGLGYRPREDRYNPSAAIVVDLSTYRRTDEVQPDQVLEPVYDDQRIRNQWTVSRTGGSAATRTDETHVARVGLYDDNVEVNVASDHVLPDHAQWRVHLGVWPEMRYPGIPVDLAANPNLLDEWLTLRLGDRAQQINPPPNHPPGAVGQIALGISQVITPARRTWVGQIMGVPARPWDVGVVEDEVLGRADTDGSELAADFEAGTDTTMTVAVAAGPLWITTLGQPDMFPFEIRCGGVVIEVIGISGGSSPQTFTVTQTPVNGVTKTIPAGTPLSLAYPWRLAL